MSNFHTENSDQFIVWFGLLMEFVGKTNIEKSHQTYCLIAKTSHLEQE